MEWGTKGRGEQDLDEVSDFLGMRRDTLKNHYFHHHPDWQAGIGERFDRMVAHHTAKARGERKAA
jgi:hypothetical protein